MENWLTFHFSQPWWLVLLALVPLRIWLRGRPGTAPGLEFSSVAIVRKIGGAVRGNSGRWRGVLGDIAFALMILALACPRIERGNANDEKEGIDIVFAADTSGSMGAGPGSKAESLREAISEFVDNRPNDRFGMIGFAYDTWLMSPLTLDGDWIKSVLENKKKYQSGSTGQGTAVGNGILAAVELMKESKGPSKVIVVATDGASNAGVAPMEAAEEARKNKIRVYTLGMNIGSSTAAFLTQISTRTDGSFFRVTGPSSLREAYRQIDRLEKSKLKQKQFRLFTELYPWCLLAALTILIVEWTIHHTVGMRIP